MTRKYFCLALGAGISVLTAMSMDIACSGSDSSGPEVSIPSAASIVPSTNVWKFGVMADTQWTQSGADNGKSPNTVAVEIMRRLNQEFIAKGVEFVIQVGDLTDTESDASLQVTSKYRQELYNAGIGFFPLRGNHEPNRGSEFVRVFPQTTTGAQNSLPDDVLAMTTSAGQVNKTGQTFTIGTNYSSPSTTSTGGADYNGLSYSFNHKNATFMFLDQFNPINGSSVGLDKVIATQQSWISNVLYNKPYGNHAFVFSHKALIHENHTDVLFGNNPSISPTSQDNFIRSLSDNGVKYFNSGHDHMYCRSIYTTTDGNKNTSVHQIVNSSNSSKFYTPVKPSPDETYNVPAFGVRRQTMLVQELYTIGYYIYTVDGSNVTVDYYSSSPVTTGSDITTTPTLTFTKKESFGYNLKGKQFIVAQGAPYTVVRDGAARILSGTNGSTAKDLADRKCSHEVTTGWTPKTAGLYTDIFTLWGMANNFGSDRTDTYCLSISYDKNSIDDSTAKSGKVGIAVKGTTTWVNAVSKNTGGTARFVDGPYDASKHGLGDWGIDVMNNRFWAVINYNADFAVAPSI
jgi:hypothetical protein